MNKAQLLDAGRSAVVVVDLQGKLVTMVHQPGRTIAATNRLMRIAGLFGRPVVLTEQYPEGLGPTHPDVRAVYDALEVPKRYVAKIAFGCCGEPAFAKALDEVLPDVPPERRQLVVAGIEAHVCVKQTVIELLNAGSEVHVCWEAVSARGEEYYRHALEDLRHAGARITNHESVGFEWARSKDHTAFKGLSKLLREGQIV